MNMYVASFTGNLQENPGSFRSYIKKAKGDGQVGVPDLMVSGGLTSDLIRDRIFK